VLVETSGVASAARNKKSRRAAIARGRPQHVGILFNEPPGFAELLFI
jgi:hypothetical protein